VSATLIVYCRFAAALAGPILFRVLARSWLGRPPTGFEGYAFVVGVSDLIPIAMAVFSDRLPVRGARRPPYLLLGGIMGVAGWFLAAKLPAGPWSWMIVSLTLAISAGSVTAAVWGAAADLLRDGAGSPGRLAALLLAGTYAAGLLRILVEDRLTWPLSKIAVFGALIAASVVVATVSARATDSERPRPASTGKFLRGRSFWSLFLICTLYSLGGGVWAWADLDRGHHVATSAAVRERLDVISGLAVLAATAVFAVVCRRIAARRLAVITLFAAALGLVILHAAPDAEGAARAAIVFAQSFGSGLATTAIASLALAAAPEGLEAFGVLLIIDGPWVVRSAILQPFLATAHPPFSVLVDGAAAACLLAVVALRLLPAE
jgi:hypothetical protein